MISAKASKVELLKAYGDLTLEKVCKMQPTSLAQLARASSAEDCMRLTAVIIADLSVFFNGDLLREDIEEIAAEVQFSMLKNLSLEDIYLACMTIKRSKISYKLTANEVLRQLNEHLDKRSTLIAELNHSSHLANQYREKSQAEIEQEKRERTKSIAELIETKKLIDTK
jgi:hypothetical protein